jgi:hypothetical protein
MMAIFQKSGRWRKDGSPHPRPGAQPREGGEARPKVELVVGDFNDPASLKPAFASVDEAFVVMNGKDLNRLEANALDRSRAFQTASASVPSTRAWCCGRCKSVNSWKTE